MQQVGSFQGQSQQANQPGVQNSNRQQQISALSLCNYASFDLPEEIEIELFQLWRDYMQISMEKTNLSERISFLQLQVSQNNDAHHRLVAGLLFAILVEPNPDKVDSHFKELSQVVRDYFEFAIKQLCTLTVTCYPKFKLQTLERIVYLTEKLLAKQVPSTKDLVLILLQQISVNKADQPSCFLNQRLLPMLEKHLAWVTAQNDSFPSLIFLKFLRLAEEHNDNYRLQEEELKFCMAIYRVRTADCHAIGREFARILCNLRNKPILKPLFAEVHLVILRQVFSEQGLQNQKYISSLVPYSIQTKIEFMLNQVPEAIYFHYARWLLDSAKIHLGAESQSLIVDVIRFIVVNVTPTNETIQSNILQRWQLIGHFVTQWRENQAMMPLILQALFIDWLFYDEYRTDHIMLVEPGMLLISRWADSRPQMADMLVNFLDEYARNFDSEKQDESFLSIQKVLIDCERKGVIKSVKDLVNNHHLKSQTQQRLKVLYTYRQQMEERQRRNNNGNLIGQGQNQAGMGLEEALGGFQIGEGADAFADHEQDLENNEAVASGAFSPPHEPIPFGSTPAEVGNVAAVQATGAGGVSIEDVNMQYGADQDSAGVPSLIIDGTTGRQVQGNRVDQSVGYSKGQNQQPYQVDRAFGSEFNMEFGQEMINDSPVIDSSMPAQSISSLVYNQNHQTQKTTTQGEDVEMKDEDSVSSSEVSSPSSSSSSDQDEQNQNEPPTQTVEIPQALVQNYFGSHDSTVLNQFVQSPTKTYFNQMLLDLAQTQTRKNEQINPSVGQQPNSLPDLTELAYILFERLKGQASLCQMTAEFLMSHQSHHQMITKLANAIAKFDPIFQAKLCLILLQKGANNASLINALHQSDLIKQALQGLVCSFEFKIMNQLLLIMVDLLVIQQNTGGNQNNMIATSSLQQAALELQDQDFFQCLLAYSTPETVQKVLFGLSIGKIHIKIGRLPSSVPAIQQQFWWKILSYSVQKQKAATLQQQANAQLMQQVRDSVQNAKSKCQQSLLNPNQSFQCQIQSELSTCLVGLHDFTQSIDSTILVGSPSSTLEWFVQSISTYQELNKIIKSLKPDQMNQSGNKGAEEILNQTKFVMRDYTRIVVTNLGRMISTRQDYILGSLLEHSQMQDNTQVVHLYRKFESPISCLTTAQTILKSQLAKQCMEQAGVSETIKSNFEKFCQVEIQ